MTLKELEELRVKRAALSVRMTELNDLTVGDAARALTSEEDQEYDTIEKDFDARTKSIEREERQNGYAGKKDDTPNPALTDQEREAEAAARETRGGKSKTGSPEYRDAFIAMIGARGMEHRLSDEQRAALQVGTDSEGGYTVPDEFHRTLEDSEREFGTIRQLARKIVTGDSGDFIIPKVATHATAVWLAEEAAYTQSEPTFGQQVLSGFKLGAYSKISEELVHDSAFDLLGFLAQDLGEALGLLENVAYVSGASGSTTTPEGIVKKATVGKTFALNSAITSDELIDLYHSLLEPYRSNAVFIVKDSTIQAVRKLKESGSGQYLWQPGLTAGAPDLLLGKPVRVDKDVPAIATVAESVIFGDIARGYWIRDIEGATVRILNELFALNGQIGVRVSKRTDGDLVDAEAIKIGKHPA